MFKGVLFDLDGVITDTAEYHYQAWKKLGEEIGISIDRSFNEQLKGVSREDSLSLMLRYGNKENDFTAEELAELAQRKNDYYLEMIQAITPKDVYPGILELLADLKTAKIKIALASASKNGPFLLQKMNLTSYFDAIADPEKIAHGKPAPDIFLLAAKEVGLTTKECLGIEDARAGIQAIVASGAQPVGVGQKKDLGENIPIVSDTTELTLAYLKEVWREHE
ncbi:beta-phosphoglucomutase [Enterococcus saccharolyticus]|uniref:Beta-phosphoglucomutase n=1 Tax=Enterococcus saccharolyticus subsp. saccharolyticus ATCC 43076 TaxID=1139996 RepID=S0JBR3_9ENTE|nr:beta-phosphoglucomutase [Enterococcus saccharolyticus]EOT29807.1 beta-phosphoglucomutase [Enterococcus saccharolyticus subsp. saccharolyticus ATCC 43076]EOT80354.1 beta-phosphoglucomutase [Enterococcus saccharolyticus subsp. saccharolyticus ATCC 43076]